MQTDGAGSFTCKFPVNLNISFFSAEGCSKLQDLDLLSVRAPEPLDKSGWSTEEKTSSSGPAASPTSPV